jgi:hypothetical protein
MKKKSVLLSVCLLIALAITKIAYDAKVRHRTANSGSPPAPTLPLKVGARAEKNPPPKLLPGITMYERIEDAPAWTIRYGKEFWKRPQTQSAAGSAGTHANFDIGDVIGRVSHAIRKDHASGLPALNAGTYGAVFTERGFTITPHAYVGDQPLPASRTTEEGERSRPAAVPIYEPDVSARSDFETTLVRAGNEILYSSPADIPSSFIGNTSQRLLNQDKGLIEHFEAGAGGIEVTWVLNQPPANGDPLDLSFRLTGLSVLRAEDEGGYVLGDTTGNPKVRISEVTLVDAGGTKVNVPLHFSDGQFNIHVSEPTLAGLTFPIAIDPTIGPAVELAMSRATDVQHEPAVAWNGNASEPRYLVVWQDARNYPQKHAIYGARVMANGRVVDTSGIRISSSSLTNEAVWPRVASNGDDWLVVWEYWTGTFNNDIYGARVAAGGTVGSHFVICNDGNYQRAPQVGAAGTNYFTVWLDSRHGSYGTAEDVFGARIPVGTTAYPANGAGVCLSDWRYSWGDVAGRNRARVAGNGTDFLVIWDGWKPDTDFPNVYGAKISASGSTNWTVTTGALGCSALIDGGAVMAGFPSLAGQNGTWFVAWQEYHMVIPCSSVGPYSKIHGALLSVNASSNLVVGASVAFSRTNSGFNYPDCANEHNPVVAGNGSGYMVAWNSSDSQHEIVGSRVSSTGTVLDIDGFVIANTPETEIDFAIAGSTNDYLFVWAGGNVSEPEPGAGHVLDIYAARISTNAPPSNVRDRFVVSTMPFSGQLSPSVSGYNPCFVVWEHLQGSNYDLYGARINSDGNSPDPNGIMISTNAANDLRPSVAGSAGLTLVVWERGGTIYGKSLEVNSGVVTVGPETTIRSGYGFTAQLPAVAGVHGSSINWLVAYEDNSSAYWQIRGNIVTWTGSALSVNSTFLINNYYANAVDQRNVSVGTDDTRYLVAWEYSANNDIYGQIVGTNGVNSGGTLTLASSFYNPLKYPSVAGRANTGFVVVYEDRPYTGSDLSNISGVPVSTNGTVGTATSIVYTNAAQYIPVVANNGSSTFLVAWHDERSSSSFDVYGSRVSIVSGGGSLSLSVADPGGFVINNELLSHQSAPAIGTCDLTYTYLVAYDHYVPTTGYRVRASLITP